MYCIVDLETTGGKGNKITEIAMIKFDGEKVVDEFTSLINPECSIPYFISKLTGITDEMVTYAPKFYQVAKEVTLFLEGCTFVAHNVFFDFNVLRNEYRELGYDFRSEKLCTVRLARKHFPGHVSYSLGKICATLGISIEDRHRAKGDAQATVELFKRILDRVSRDELEREARPKHKFSLPPKLDEDLLLQAPEGTGIYYLKDESGQVLYVGKSVNIKKRLASHFRVNLKRKKDVELKNQVANIDYQVTHNELVALILEAQEIKKLRPQFNSSLNRVKFRYCLDLKEVDGYLLPTVSTRAHENCARHFRERKVVNELIGALFRELFSLNYEARSFEDDLAKWQKILGREIFNQRVESWLARFEYSTYEGEIEYFKGSERLRLTIKDGILNSMKVENNEDQIYYSVEEDPEIKRMILSKITS